MNKICKNCGKYKKYYAKGLCKNCYMKQPCRKSYVKEYYLKNKEKIKIKGKKYRDENREKIKKAVHKWQKNNQEKLKMVAKEYYIKHKKEIKKRYKKHKIEKLEYLKKWKVNHPGYDKKWKRDNPEKRKAINKKYNQSFKGKLYAKQQKAKRSVGKPAKIIKQIVQENIFKYGTVTCEKCERRCFDNYQIDHIIPICKGGNNDRNNLQVLCAKCNQEKHVKIADYRQDIEGNQLFLREAI